MADSVPAPMVQVPADKVEALRVKVRIVDEQAICEGEAHTEQQVAELDMVYDAAADLVDWLEPYQVALRASVVDAATPAASDEDTPISADHLRRAVLQWASRFIPGDRWDTEDVRDLETALGGTVENRCHHRSFDAASVPAADILALANEWYPGTPGPRRMTSWARLAYQDCARELRALVDERQPQRCEHGILRRLDCFECNEVAAAEQADKGDGADTMHDCNSGGEDGYCSNCDPALAFTFPAREQADKGEAADTPRDEEAIKCPTCGVARGWNEDGRLTRGIWTLNCVRCGSFQVEIEDAPAAPPETVCRCGHPKHDHFRSTTGCGVRVPLCQCTAFNARVPVNDEAEASTVASFAPLLTPEERASLVRNLADGPLRWVSREFADFPEIRFDKANEIMGRLKPLLESLVAARLAKTWRRGYLDHAQFEPPSDEYIDALNPFRAARQGGNSDESE